MRFLGLNYIRDQFFNAKLKISCSQNHQFIQVGISLINFVAKNDCLYSYVQPKLQT